MKLNPTLALSLALIFLFAGCMTHDGGRHIVTGQARPGIAPEAVKIYLEQPTAKYEIIGQVTASAFGDTQSHREKAVQDLKTHAGLMGANGIVLDPTTYGDLLSSPSLRGGAITYTGKAIFVPPQ